MGLIRVAEEKCVIDKRTVGLCWSAPTTLLSYYLKTIGLVLPVSDCPFCLCLLQALLPWINHITFFGPSFFLKESNQFP